MVAWRSCGMKYILIIGDGMADNPVPELGGRTPLQVAAKPAMDALASAGVVGSVQNVPEGLPAGSDHGYSVNIRVRSSGVLFGARSAGSGRRRRQAVSGGCGVPVQHGLLRGHGRTLRGETHTIPLGGLHRGRHVGAACPWTSSITRAFGGWPDPPA